MEKNLWALKLRYFDISSANSSHFAWCHNEYAKNFDRLLAWIPLGSPANSWRTVLCGWSPERNKLHKWSAYRGEIRSYVSTQGKDRKRHQAWIRFVRKHRPKWSGTNSSFLYSDHFDENRCTKNQEITAKRGMKRKLKPDAVDWFIVGRHSRYHWSVTDR